MYSYNGLISFSKEPIAERRILLYLLDTDIDINSEEDRTISYQLYGGDNENRLKQEIMLGIGGILALQKLGIKQDVYHCNEGHAALINLQRLVDYVENNKLSIYEALEVVRSSSIYTIHTPVPTKHKIKVFIIYSIILYKDIK